MNENMQKMLQGARLIHYSEVINSVFILSGHIINIYSADNFFEYDVITLVSPDNVSYDFFKEAVDDYIRETHMLERIEAGLTSKALKISTGHSGILERIEAGLTE